jgi:xanthine dehydrogenase accessory factor
LPKDPALQEKLNGFSNDHGNTALIDIDNNHYVVAPIQPPDTAYIIGAGHVSKEIALLTKQVGFRTLVFDDRGEFANTERFPDVDGVYVCGDFAGVFDTFAITPGSYIVIVTRGHRFDKEVLAQALGTDAGYIGMIGSRKKRDYVYSQLRNEGFDSSELERVYCPIGLAIDAETPAEIAVSIVAQMIHHRANRRKNG